MKRSLSITYLAINVACALVMLYAAHQVAAVMTLEQRGVPDAVDSVTFVAHSAVAWTIGVLANVAWIILALIDLFRRRGGKALGWLGAAAAVWGVSFLAIRVIDR